MVIPALIPHLTWDFTEKKQKKIVKSNRRIFLIISGLLVKQVNQNNFYSNNASVKSMQIILAITQNYKSEQLATFVFQLTD